MIGINYYAFMKRDSFGKVGDMLISAKELANRSALKSTFGKGVFLHSTDAVEDIFVSETTGESVTFQGTVKGEGRKYKNSITFAVDTDKDEANYEQCYCECPAFDTYGGFCKHIVASILSINSKYDKEQLLDMVSGYKKDATSVIRGSKVTSADLMEAMSGIMQADRSRFCESVAHGDVELEPTLYIDADRERLDFKIGITQKYVIKNIQEFKWNIKNQNYLSYGKSLSFTHTQSRFSKLSQGLVGMILEYDLGNEVEEPFYYPKKKSGDKRFMTLSAYNIDELMEMYEGRELNVVSCIEGILVKTKVVRENPRIEVEIFGDRSDRVQIKFPRMLVLYGVRKFYICYEHKIYICSDEYCNEMKNIVKLMALNYLGQDRKNATVRGKVVQPKKESVYYLGESEYAAFCATLLPLLEKNMDVDMWDIDFSRYQAEEGEYSVYFDLTEEMDVICRAEVRYGEKVHNMIKPAALDETHRDIRMEYEVRSILEKYLNETGMAGTVYAINGDDDRLAELIEYGLAELREYVSIYASDAFKKIRIAKNVKVNAGLSIKGNLLDVSWDVDGMSKEELTYVLSAYKKKQKYYRLKNGELLNIKNSGIDVLAQLYEEMKISKTELRDGMAEIPIYRAMYIDALMKENAAKILTKREESFEKIIEGYEKIRSKKYQVPKSIQAKVRGYQKEGYRWAMSLSELGFGGILADDMGLGKTLQMIMYITAKKEGTALIVCPASLMYNWGEEFKRFSPSLKVCLVLGNAAEREALIEKYEEYDVLVTSYDLLKRDISIYEGKEFSTQIIDEAQNIKNHTTQSSKAVKAINSKVRFALTGTPIENRLSELWSIFEYIMPGYLYSYKHFKESYEEKIMHLEAGSESEKYALKRLQMMINPFVLRRLKTGVLKDLPEKIEKVVYSKLEDEQDRLYKAVEKNIITTLNTKSDKEIKENKLLILAELTKLRQICCAPELLYDGYKGNAAKLEACVELVQTAVAGGHKILLFSQFTSMLQILAKRFHQLGIHTFMLTGATSKIKRQEMVNEYNSGGAEVFLISLKAGGTGLNLTEADMVIHYDPWWNEAAQNQATDRAYRIGQKNTVTVVKLIAKDTIEERILKLQEKKKQLADKIISGEGLGVTELNREQLLELFGH